MKILSVAGGVVKNSSGKIIIVNQKGTSWSLPKGHQEAGESLLATAKREIFEETGISEITLLKEIGTYERYKISHDGGDDTKEKKIITMFLFASEQNKLVPIDKDNPEARWVSIEEATKMLTHRKDREFLIGIMNDI